MEGNQFDILLIVLYCSSLKLISSLIPYLTAAMNIMEVCLAECIDGLKLPNKYNYSSKRNVYNGLGGLFHLTIRPGSCTIYMWPYSFELYHSMRGSISFEQRMLFEWARFESFQKAPETLRMWKIKLAKNGFYYTGSGTKCNCAFCGVVYGNWRYTDDPEEVHRRLSPNCPLVHDRMNSNNIPINARERLQEQSAALSLAGNPNHTAVWQHGHVARYQTREDIPEQTGQNVRNELQNLMITIRRFEEEFDAIRSVSTQHVVDMQRARNHNYVQLDTRIESFGNWPSSNQAPRNLAQAGFYYTGEDDCCRCFFCDGGLREWEPGDDPWSEHARWFPNCDFVRTWMGDEFVNSIQQQAELNDPGDPSENDVNSVETSQLALITAQLQAENHRLISLNRNDLGNSSENDVNSSKTTNSVETSLLITEIHRHAEGLKCLKCKTERICMMFIPCGHTITCEDCSKIIQRCFKCNKVVTKALKVLIP